MPDIDLDLADRSKLLSKIQHISASIFQQDQVIKHNTGVYCQQIPYNAITNCANIDYKEAEQRGYFKLDFLNVHIYQQIKNEQHLNELLQIQPAWERLYDRDFCEKLIHIKNHYDTLISMPEAVTSIEKMAMFLAIIRPGKRHLIGKPWAKVSETVWEKPTDGSYGYKKSHGIAYAHLVAVHMNLINQLDNTPN